MNLELPSLFWVRESVLNLAHVSFAEWNIDDDDDYDGEVKRLEVYTIGSDDPILYDAKSGHRLLKALATYHELFEGAKPK